MCSISSTTVVHDETGIRHSSVNVEEESWHTIHEIGILQPQPEVLVVVGEGPVVGIFHELAYSISETHSIYRSARNVVTRRIH